jgi:hypothetical protein
MDVRMMLAPLYAAGLSALVIAAFTFGRKDARAFMPQWPLAWFGLLAAISLMVASNYGLVSLGMPLESTAGRGVGLGLLGLAAGLALLGSKARLRADTLRGSAPRSIDEAVEELRAGRTPGWGVYRGRIGASEQMTSPGGVVCAFYDAELRTVGPQGRKGALISQEKAYALVITVRGERTEAVVSFTPSAMLAPLQVRRCLTDPRLTEPEAGELAAGRPVEEVLSYERVGKLGEPCLVVGELHKGPAPGSYVLRGLQGGPAMVLLGQERMGSGQQLARRAWGLFSAAGALSVVAAFVLSRTL